MTQPTPAAPSPAETSADEGTRLARERTSLALDRSFLALERTLMAWLRTSLSMISFGFTLVKFFEFLEDQRHGPIVGRLGRIWLPTSVGTTMILIGTGALILAIIQHRHRVAALRREGLPPQWSLALSVSTLVSMLGVFVLLSLAVE